MSDTSEDKILLLTESRQFGREVKEILGDTYHLEIHTSPDNYERNSSFRGVVILDARTEYTDKNSFDYFFQNDADCRLIVAAPEAEVEKAVEAMKRGAFHYFGLPLIDEELTNIVENAFESLRLDEENRSLKMELSLFKIIKTMATTLEMEKVLNMFTDAAMELAEADNGAFLLKDSENSDFDLVEMRGLSQDLTSGGIFGFKNEALAEYFQKDETVILNKPEKEKDGYIGGAGDAEFSSVMILQIKADDDKVGLLILTKVGEFNQDFTGRKSRILEMLVSETAEVLENAFSYKETRELTLKDDLTQAYNRRYFENYLEEEIERSRRFDKKLSIIFLDMDNLKTVNNRYGHFMGSRALREAAGRIINTVRAIDKVVRYGGDEFCIVLPETDSAGAKKVAKRIRKTVSEKPFLLENTEGVTLSASIGVASFPKDAETKKSLVRLADAAMFTIKESRKDGVLMASDLSSEAKRSKGSRE